MNEPGLKWVNHSELMKLSRDRDDKKIDYELVAWPTANSPYLLKFCIKVK